MKRVDSFMSYEPPKDLFQELPSKTCRRVLLYLDYRDVKQLGFVNHFWSKKSSIIRKNCEEFLKLQDVSKLLEVGQGFSHIESGLLLQGAVNLKDVKLSTQVLRRSILNSVKNLSVLEAFELSAKYPTLDILHHYPRIYAKIGAVTRMPDSEEKWLALSDKCLWLIEEGLIEKTLETADIMPDVSQKWDVFESISVYYVKEGLFLQAFDVMTKVPDANRRMIVIYEIVNELYATRQIDEAMTTIDGLPSNADKDHILQCISNIWTKNNDPQKALAALKMMEDTRPKWIALRNMCSPYAKKRDTFGVRITSSMITDKHSRERALLPIAFDWIDKRIMDKALMVLDLLPDGEGKWRAFQEMSLVHLRDNETNKAIECANKILDDEVKEQTIFYMVLTALKRDDIVTALTVLKMMGDGRLKWVGICNICSVFVKQYNIYGVLQLAPLITDNLYREKALLPIAYDLTDKRLMDDAIKVLDLLPDGDGKWNALQKMCLVHIADNRIDEAEQCAERILDVVIRENTLLDIVLAWLKSGHLDAAERVSGMMIDGERKWTAIQYICSSIVVVYGIEKALQISKQLPDGYFHEQALASMAYVLSRTGKWEDAKKVLDLVPEGQLKQQVIQEICSIYLEMDDIASLSATIKLIPDVKDQKVMVKPLVKRLALEGKFNKTEMILDLMPNDGVKWQTFRYFSLNDLANARKWLQKIDDEKIKEMACKDIITKLLEKDQLEGTQEILNMMPDDYSKWIACHNVCMAWMKKDSEKAKEIANLILNPVMRENAYKYMGLTVSIDV